MPGFTVRVAVAALLALAAGCAGLGERVGRTSLPPGAPSVEAVLRDLAANDALIRSFRAGGNFEIASPEFEAVKSFTGSIRFRRPTDLYVQGNQRVTGITMFKLVCIGQEFLMEFPHSKDESFYQIEGEQFEDVPFSVSPSDVAREMFLPEDWAALKRRSVRMVDFDPAAETAVMSVGPDGYARRRVEVVRVNAQDPKWVLKQNTRFAETGEVLAITTLDEYTSVDGALFPTKVQATFPTEETRMKFTMRNVRLNVEVPDKYFDIRERARELNLEERQASTHD